MKNESRGFSLQEMLVAVAGLVVALAMAVPIGTSIMQNLRTGGDARSLSDLVMEAKMHAAADFTHARVYVDLSAGTYRIETWSKSGSWQAQFTDSNGNTVNNSFSQGVSMGYGSLATPPASTQSTIGQAPACTDSTHDGGTGTVAQTSCIEFNSRGIPVDSNFAPTANDAFYLTDGGSTYAITVTASGMVQVWRTDASSASWALR